jgi:DNA polymerase-3 subunit delta
MSRDLEALLAGIEEHGKAQPCYLISGDRVVAEPAAIRLGETLGKKLGCAPSIHKRPAQLLPLLDDLRTFSLFDPAKVMVVVESSVVADLSAAASLIDHAAKVLPVDARTEDMTSRERDAAIQLMQAIRLFQLDPYGGAAEQLIGRLPEWAFQGEGSLRKRKSGRARTKKRILELREQAAGLLDLARSAGLQGRAQGDAEAVVEMVENGLPEGHVLILAESSVVPKHPLLAALGARGALVQLGRVEAGRRGFEGIETLTEELQRQTGVTMDIRAVEELARRTLRKESDRGGGDAVDADSTARFAAEYRKLAEVAAGDRIDLAMVEQSVEDRGEEDVWKILDDIGAGRAGAANTKLRRHIATSDEPMSMRLSFFSLLASYCRHLAAIAGALDRSGLPRGERNYNRFKSSIAPKLQRDLPNGAKSPLGGLHPFRLHKAYLAASRLPREKLVGLPGRVLEAEMRLKGESRSPEAVLELLVADVAGT